MTHEAGTAGPDIWRELTIRGVRLRHRIGLAPMSQYSAPDGDPTPWHVQHYADRSFGLGLTLVEATAITRESRVTPHDLVLDEDSDLAAWSVLSRAIREAGSVPGVQLSHAGRKASRTRPWDGDRPIPLDEGGWEPVGPTDEPFGPGQLRPRPLSASEAAEIPAQFARSAALAVEAGFDLLEIHAGHGRLLHTFYSPLANSRDDEYGETWEGRLKLLVDTTAAVRSTIGADRALMVRLSCSDWVDGGWTPDDTVAAARALEPAGADLIDCTSGGVLNSIRISRAPGYQVPFAEKVRSESPLLSAAVGEIRTLAQAAETIGEHRADLVLLGRPLLVDPFYVARTTQRADLLPPPYRRGLSRASHALVAGGAPEL